MFYLKPHIAGNELRKELEKELTPLIKKALEINPPKNKSMLSVIAPPYLRGTVENILHKIGIEANFEELKRGHLISVEGKGTGIAEHEIKVRMTPTEEEIDENTVYSEIFEKRGGLLYPKKESALYKKAKKEWGELAERIPLFSLQKRLERPYLHYTEFIEFAEKLLAARKNKKLEEMLYYCAKKLKS